LFGNRFGIQLPLWNEGRLKLFIVGCYPLIRFPVKSVPTDPGGKHQIKGLDYWGVAMVAALGWLLI